MTKLDFSAINKSSAQSFHSHKNIIKKIGRGETVLCSTCQQPLTLITAQKGQPNLIPGIRCKKGCTNIELEFAM
ncbi:MAG: hypothetical protein HRU22_04415 [Gammaproteobacteria bacterium]|nr:hypothetical protein [Gammaproteobacteria bacterium]